MFNSLIKVFPDAKLGLGDTDSLIAEIPDHENNYFTKLRSMSHLLDLSQLMHIKGLGDTTNESVPGKWKVSHFNALEVCSVVPKCYSILL